MKTPRLPEGVYNITPTPFLPDENLDETSLARLAGFLTDLGVQGLTILGVLGEAGKLTDAEWERVIEIVIETVDGRIPVCVGASHGSTAGAAARARRAERLGAAAVMIAPPRLARPNDEALRRHYLGVAEATTLPVVVQDHPGSTGVHMSPGFLAALSDEAPSCRYLKLEDPPTPDKVTRVRELDSRITIYGGLGGLMFLEELAHGAAGTMTGYAFPEHLVEIRNRFLAGDEAGAAALFDRYMPLIRFENQPLISLALRKRIYRLRGAIASDRVRHPGARPVEATYRDLEGLLERLDLT